MNKLFAFCAALFTMLLIGVHFVSAQEATNTPDVGWPVVERCKDSIPDKRTDAIAFASDQAGTQQIYTMDVEGNHQQKISRLIDANLSDLDWSPNGKQMAFTNNYHIYRLNIELQAATQLTTNPRGDSQPAWSPDGRYIAYISTRGGPYDIWLMKPNGANIRQMTYDPRWELTVRWSPDGQGFGYVPNSGANLSIWIETDKGDEIFMNLSPNDDRAFHGVTDFRWSPNGKHFSMQTDFGAYLVNRDGSNLRLIVDKDVYGYDGAPSWSPDSCHLVFRMKQNDEEGIYMMNLYDGSTHLLSHSGWDPVWKP